MDLQDRRLELMSEVFKGLGLDAAQTLELTYSLHQVLIEAELLSEELGERPGVAREFSVAGAANVEYAKDLPCDSNRGDDHAASVGEGLQIQASSVRNVGIDLDLLGVYYTSASRGRWPFEYREVTSPSRPNLLGGPGIPGSALGCFEVELVALLVQQADIGDLCGLDDGTRGLEGAAKDSPLVGFLPGDLLLDEAVELADAGDEALKGAVLLFNLLAAQPMAPGLADLGRD